MIYCSRYSREDDTFIKISTDLLELLLPVLKGSELKVLLFLAKWQKPNRVADANYVYIEEGTGISRPVVKKAVSVLKTLGLIRKAESRGYLVLSRDVEEFVNDQEVNKVYQDRGFTGVRKFTPVGKESLPKRVKKVYTKQEDPTDLKKGEEERALRATPSALSSGEVQSAEIVPLFVENAGQLDHVRLCQAYIKVGEDLRNAEVRASLHGNTSMRMSYFKKEFPESYLPPFAPETDNDDFRRLVFLEATNVIVECQREAGVVVSIPGNTRDVEILGDVVSSFLGLSNWTSAFRSFYRWVLEYKPKYPYGLLTHYYSDWVESAATGDFGNAVL